MMKSEARTGAARGGKLVIINQAANYLTIGFANAFKKRFDDVALITGSVHAQGEELDDSIAVTFINRWHERPSWKKAASPKECTASANKRVMMRGEVGGHTDGEVGGHRTLNHTDDTDTRTYTDKH